MWTSGVADPPEGGPNAADHPALRAARWLVEFVTHRFLFGWGLLLLAVAVGILTTAWVELSGQQRSLLQRMTARGTVRVLDAAVAVESQSGPDVLMDPSRAVDHHDYRFEYLLELSYLSNRPSRRYRTAPVATFVDRPFWPVVAQARFFQTPHFVVKVDKALHELLAKTPDRLEQFRASFDMPMHALAVEWLTASRDPNVAVRYDPRQPGTFLFEQAFGAATDAQSPGCSIVAGLILGGLGVFVLVFAVSLLTAGMSNVWVPRALFLAVLVSVPVASGLLQSAAAWLGLPELPAAFLREWTRSTDPRSRAGFLEELPATGPAAAVTIPVDVPNSRDKDVFAFFTVNRGRPRYATFQEAMDHISAQIADQMVVMPAADLFRFFKVLDLHMDRRQAGWDGPFLEGVRRIALDSTRSANLRSWAISAFCDMADERQDAALAEAIYREYVVSEPGIRGYWRSFFADYARAPSFAADLQSVDGPRIRRALELWVSHGEFLDDVRPLVPRLRQLTTHADPEVRKLALRKWNSRNDWEGRR